MPSGLLREDRNGLCLLTLNRPEKHNALDTELFERLDAELAALELQLDTVGCVILQGAGKSFCAGADLGKITGALPPPTFKPGVIERLANLPQPVIARVHGNCVTGGLELALAADLIVAGQSARFADTHGRWGLVGGWGMTQRLPRRVGQAQAKRMMFTAGVLDADEALRIGLADFCVPDEVLDETLRGLADAVLANSWHTNVATKRLLRETEGMRLTDGLAHEHYRFPGLAPDWQERIERFRRRT